MKSNTSNTSKMLRTDRPGRAGADNVGGEPRHESRVPDPSGRSTLSDEQDAAKEHTEAGDLLQHSPPCGSLARRYNGIRAR